MNRIVPIIDAVTEVSGKLCAWIFFAVGLFVTYEVVMRYVFTAPTIWVDEVARIMQIWATYLASSWVLKHRQMITIEIILKNNKSLLRRLAETLGISMLMLFASTAMYFGFQLWLKSTLAGHTTDSFLGSPKWLTHSSVWIGMTLLILQGLVELYRVWFVGIPADNHDPLAEAN